MVTITIPKKITKGKELVIVPKEDWEKILKLAKKKISKLELEKDLEKALEDVKKGRLIGPFDKVGDLIKSLEK
ncbi:MAG: hypothetical protein COX90_04265 [Candidatus Nealsonbacteria bacterium CG_4_10_14_0_2_um_filter_38_17]|uniref:Uncharacterized protein n=2 Tax=Candidatus Nealsoniibacteriota TaxID=1817911 RepID=A0A2M7UX39_9BACT|nr:MAG: hypothetical protein COX36_01820 [Candidatus Nealsonbacteria bacterium CG23_combo_of_CG06-09_8_20_14_all_38_19]PIZ88478.1 MAG: hypothetical protein COX90_04265 [Candidatus Nealsonbacteria bacterium CG_4_10_14_0_2_um_filter_38_17]